MITKADWDTIQHELFEVDQQSLGDPPTVEEMLAYARGELAPRDEERIRRLLVDYPELAHALTAPFPEDDAMPGDAGYLSDDEITSRFMDFRAALPEADADPNAVRFWRRWTAAIAAMLALVVAGTIFEVHRLRVALRAPQATSAEIVLSPDGQRGRPMLPPKLATMADSTLLVLPLVGPASFVEFRLEIATEGGEVAWRSSTLRVVDNDDTLTILLPRAFLRPGKYKVLLYGLDGTHEEQLATYPLRVP